MRIRAVSPDPSLFTHVKYEKYEGSDQKIRHLAQLDGRVCVFKNEFMKDEKCHHFMSWFNLFLPIKNYMNKTCLKSL